MTFPPDSTSGEREDQLEEVLCDYLDALDEGRAPDQLELLGRHPELADELRQFFDDEERLDRVADPLKLPPPENSVVHPGTRLGEYEVHERLGMGAMGVVYRAWQPGLEKWVALKTIRDSELADEGERERFRAEARALAQFDHPNIVPIYEVDERDGQHFFSMKLIEGGSLARPPAGFDLNQRGIARLMTRVAQAVHHAHKRGILHRDLKPSNILLDKDGEPYVADFGLAKRLPAPGDSGATLTRSGAIVGTVSYMAPEQARAEKVLTTAADVYGLGAVLYELLTRQAPFVGTDIVELLLRVREQEPPRPRSLNPRADRDLETVCLKCLEKDPAKRYASAEALAQDLERWLRGEPIQARRASARERIVKWVRRRPAVAALLGTTLLALVIGAAAFVWQSLETSKALARAENQLYLHRIALAQFYATTGQLQRVAETLDDCRPEHLRQWEWYYLRRLCQLERKTLAGHRGEVRAAQYSPDGLLLATTGTDRTVRIWDAVRGKELRQWPSDSPFTDGVCFAADGRHLLTASDEQTITVWEVASGKPLVRLPNAGSLVAASRKANRVAAISRDHTVTAWDLLDDGKAVSLRECFRLHHDEDRVLDIALSPDGRHLALGGYNRLIRVSEILPHGAATAASLLAAAAPPAAHPWSLAGQASAGPLCNALASRPFSRELHVGVTRVRAVCFSDDGKYLAAGSAYPSVWEVSSGRLLRSFVGTGDLICRSVSFSRDGSRLAAAFGDRLVRVWDTRDGGVVLTPPRQKETVWGAVFCPGDNHHLAVLCGAEVTIENVNPSSIRTSLVLEPRAEGSSVRALAFSPDGDRLAARDTRGRVLVWDVATRHNLWQAGPRAGTDPTGDLLFSADGQSLLAPGGVGGLATWDAEAGRPGVPPVRTAGVSVLARSPDGRHLATGDGTSRVRVWDPVTGEESRTLEGVPMEVKAVAFAPDGRRLAACGTNAAVAVWDVDSGKLLHRCGGHKQTVTCVAFSPDGRQLATGSADLTVQVWDLAGGGRDLRRLHRLTGHSGYVAGVCFSPDGRRLASCGLDRTVKLWDPHSGQEVLTLTGHGGHVAAVAFSPDGTRLASCGDDGTVRLWDARPLDEDAP